VIVALVTAAQVRDLIPQLTGTGDDTRLGVLIGQAETALARWLFFPRAADGTYALEDKSYVFYLPGPEEDAPRDLKIPIRPIVSVTSVYQDSDESHGTLVASTDYLVTLDLLTRGIVKLVQAPACGGWLVGDRPIKATVVAGWATAPDYVVQAVAWQVQYALGQARTGGKAANENAEPLGFGVDPRVEGLLGPDRLWENSCG
jgi:hypothetical protein